jgi:hypothetical protein
VLLRICQGPLTNMSESVYYMQMSERTLWTNTQILAFFQEEEEEEEEEEEDFRTLILSLNFLFENP